MTLGPAKNLVHYEQPLRPSLVPHLCYAKSFNSLERGKRERESKAVLKSQVLEQIQSEPLVLVTSLVPQLLTELIFLIFQTEIL